MIIHHVPPESYPFFREKHENGKNSRHQNAKPQIDSDPLLGRQEHKLRQSGKKDAKHGLDRLSQHIVTEAESRADRSGLHQNTQATEAQKPGTKDHPQTAVFDVTQRSAADGQLQKSVEGDLRRGSEIPDKPTVAESNDHPK